ncbi:hypothetical protein AB833_23325 [Chromatiales bacterium (ex Bugula neritina AB1)]|nr:hypothetical protein AB833_23325 [Chromatiales bacterium (ex Bugula neritina AB1)]
MSHSPNDPEAGRAPGFVSRWSRLKQQGVESDSLDSVPSGDLPEIADPAAIDNTQTNALWVADDAQDGLAPEEQPVLTDADMPPLESLNADSDYSPFFSEGVSKQLRNLALKKLFFSGKFASRDGLDDYDDDFTRFEPLGDTITSDMKFHERRKEKARLAELEEEERRRLAEQSDQNAEDQGASEAAADSPADDDSIGTPDENTPDENTKDQLDSTAPVMAGDESPEMESADPASTEGSVDPVDTQMAENQSSAGDKA